MIQQKRWSLLVCLTLFVVCLTVPNLTIAQEPPADAFANMRGVTEVRRDGSTVRLQALEGVDALLKTIARYRVVDLRTEQSNLEDIFLAYYEGAEEPPRIEVEGRRHAAS